MWLLFFNGLTYLFLNIVSGRFKARFFPIRMRDLITDLIAALKGKLTHDTLSEYNAVQKLAYLLVIADVALLDAIRIGGVEIGAIYAVTRAHGWLR